MSEEVKKRVSQRRSIISGSTENKNLVGHPGQAGGESLSRLTHSHSQPLVKHTLAQWSEDNPIHIPVASSVHAQVVVRATSGREMLWSGESKDKHISEKEFCSGMPFPLTLSEGWRQHDFETFHSQGVIGNLGTSAVPSQSCQALVLFKP